MDFNPQDMDVVAWLAKLKSVEAPYPSDLFFPRRLAYTTRVAQLAATPLANPPKTHFGGMFETLLLVVIVVEALIAAYIYREQIADFMQINLVRTPISTGIPSLPEIIAPSSPTASTAAPITPTFKGKNSETNEQVVSTPDLKSNNGNHYGQTPKPERTKDKGNNDKGGGKDKDR